MMPGKGEEIPPSPFHVLCLLCPSNASHKHPHAQTTLPGPFVYLLWGTSWLLVFSGLTYILDQWILAFLHLSMGSCKQLVYHVSYSCHGGPLFRTGACR